MNTLYELGLQFNTDKIVRHRYDLAYDAYFKQKRLDNVKLLELGIGGEGYEDGGGSLSMWKSYFPNGQIIGVDIYDKTYLANDRIQIEVGDISDTSFLHKLVEKYGKFDFVIDDASHKSPDTLTALFVLGHAIIDGGYYVIEDIQTSYWPAYGGSSLATNFLDTPIAWIKHAVDIVNRRDILFPEHFPLKAGFSFSEVHVHQNIAFLKIDSLPVEKLQLTDEAVESFRNNDMHNYGEYLNKIKLFEKNRLEFLKK
jgi:hypothetical protein